MCDAHHSVCCVQFEYVLLYDMRLHLFSGSNGENLLTSNSHEKSTYFFMECVCLLLMLTCNEYMFD